MESVEARLPVVAPRERVDLPSWASERREALEERLLHHGALLFRGFPDLDATGLESLVEALGGSAMEYVDRAAPRTRVSGAVYTATDHPPTHRIFPHNEGVFAWRFPLRIFFHCRVPAGTGGETPLADVRRVLSRLDGRIRERFAERGVLYLRNFRKGPFGLSWQEAFQTRDRAALERFCADANIETEWLAEDRLRTRQVRPAIGRHPRTGEEAWLNHVAALHPSTLPPPKRRMLARLFPDDDDLPTDVRYGDGAPIEPETLDAVREAYRAESLPVRWRAGDVLYLDNALVAHGRERYSGERRLFVIMADPVTWDRLAPGSP